MLAFNQRLACGRRAGLSLTADAFLHIDALVAPLPTLAADAVTELQRLLAAIPGRVVRYAFHWRA